MTATRTAPLRIRRRTLAACTAAWLACAACCLAAEAPDAAPAAEPGAHESVQIPVPPARVWEVELADFSVASYRRALDRILPDYERQTGRSLVPGEKKRVALKVLAPPGGGGATPSNLVRACIAWLRERGFPQEGIVIVDQSESRLRDAGYLPPLSQRALSFEGHPVWLIDDERRYDTRWYYDSPLPSRVDLTPRQEMALLNFSPLEERKSLLPAPLLFDVDFWINLPAVTDHPSYEVSGALANASLWASSNTLRFQRSMAAAGAVAEIAAVPELRLTWAVTLMSLERYQFIGGPWFNSLYVVSEPRLWAGDNPVILDALMARRFAPLRKAARFPELPETPRVVELAQRIGLGSGDVNSVEWIRP